VTADIAVKHLGAFDNYDERENAMYKGIEIFNMFERVLKHDGDYSQENREYKNELEVKL